MGYVLFLRPPTAEVPVDRLRLQQAAEAAGMQRETGNLSLTSSGGRVHVALVERGLDLEVPFGAAEADFRATLLLGAELASKLELLFIDPQRSQEITPASAEEAVRNWTQANRYAVDMAGKVEDVRNAVPIEPVKPQWNTRSKILVGIIAGLFVVYQLLMLSLDFIKPPLRPID